MLIPYENRTVYIASEPIDFRMSIDGLSTFINREQGSHLHDGSIYVFYNRHRDKIKCLFWDRNGFVLYYKRLDKCKFKMKDMLHTIETISAEELEILLSGMESPKQDKVHRLIHSSKI
jgi:transposase